MIIDRATANDKYPRGYFRDAPTAARMAAMAAGRGKLLRQAMAMRREGAGLVNGTGTTSWLWYLGVSASRNMPIEKLRP